MCHFTERPKLHTILRPNGGVGEGEDGAWKGDRRTQYLRRDGGMLPASSSTRPDCCHLQTWKADGHSRAALEAWLIRFEHRFMADHRNHKGGLFLEHFAASAQAAASRQMEIGWLLSCPQPCKLAVQLRSFVRGIAAQTHTNKPLFALHRQCYG